MTLGDLIRDGASTLSNAGDTDALNDAKLFAMHILKLSYSDLFLSLKDEAVDSVVSEFKEFVDRRCKHEPTQYIIGSTCFMGYDFWVMSGVLIPRPETEILVERACELTKNKQYVKALDMCCGSGCIGISYKLFRADKQYGNTDVTLADISENAIELSARNNLKHNCGCNIIRTDLFDKIDGQYDIILSNPPYIRTADIAELTEEVKEHEPILALDGMEDGLFFYRKIIQAAKDYLSPDGVIIFEIGYDQFEDVKHLLEVQSFKDIILTRDYTGRERIVSARVS